MGLIREGEGVAAKLLSPSAFRSTASASRNRRSSARARRRPPARFPSPRGQRRCWRCLCSGQVGDDLDRVGGKEHGRGEQRPFRHPAPGPVGGRGRVDPTPQHTGGAPVPGDRTGRRCLSR
ncbi:hypothetical protein ABFP37_18820 [Burkholderia sp. RS01]|uniref:hypothetical protein n=1 Tax=unclassified Burkholderia TaxID=2613784 RepID=UPI0032182EC5